jgi:RNA polymerase sigma-70 factor (ECF subfamily)
VIEAVGDSMNLASFESDEAYPAKIEEWLIAARQGDLAARWQSRESCRDYLLLVAHRSRLPKRDRGLEPLDFVQSTMIEGWRGFSRFEGRTAGQVRAWLRVILVHLLFREARKPVEIRFELGRLGHEPIDTFTPASAVAESRDTYAALDSALLRLPEHYRSAIRLRLWDDLTFSEIGTRMGVSEDSARKLLARAIDRMRDLIGPNDDPR